MSRSVDSEQSLKMFLQMHDTAGKYHLHFSTVRTTSLSLILPIGILASVTLLREPCNQYLTYFSYLFVVIIVAISIRLNFIFSKWSSRSRSIEQYYENCIRDNVLFDPEEHAFRNLWKHQRGIKEGNEWDEFTSMTIIGGMLYLLLYIYFGQLIKVCA